MNYFDEIKKILAEKTNAKVSLNSTLKDLNLDSLDMMDIILTAEKKYKIFLSDEELLSIKTIDDLIKIVEKRKK